MKKTTILVLTLVFCVAHLFSQVPIGAKETFHIKVEQENRFYVSDYHSLYFTQYPPISKAFMTNGALVEFAYRNITLGSTFLTDHDKGGGTNKIDFDLGYDIKLLETLNVQPFVGCELNAYGSGMTVGTKLNKNFDLFDHVSLGVFLGCRYSKSYDILNNLSKYYWLDYASTQYVSASIGAYCLLFDYKRHQMRKNVWK